MFWKSFLSLHHFGIQKCKNQLFEENKALSAVFIEFKYRWLRTWLVELKKKNTKHLTFCFLQISSAAHTKIIIWVLFFYFFFVNMFDKTPSNLMSPFSNDIFFVILYPPSILTWTFKGHLNCICERFLLFF